MVLYTAGATELYGFRYAGETSLLGEAGEGLLLPNLSTGKLDKWPFLTALFTRPGGQGPSSTRT